MAIAGVMEIRMFRDAADGEAFRALNEEWISRYFALEEHDRLVLGHPEREVLGKGGRILMVEVEGATVGCVALIPMGDRVCELSKMAIAPGMRGLGIGRQLLERAILEARAMGARGLFLGSNRKLANAVHLYESLGFVHVPKERLPVLGYKRADVFMEMAL